MRYETSDQMYSFLMHYGVPGQKKGTRRYQNEDGTLTQEGRDHYGVGDPRQPGQGNTAQKMSLIERSRRIKQNQYKMARNRGENRLSAWISSRTPIGVIRSSKRAQRRRQETIARKRAEREAMLNR